MAKVKRKQIDFGGTEEQVVRGDGSLGNYDKKVVVNLTTDKTDISEIENEALECNKTAKELMDLFKSETPIEWRLILKGEKPITYTLEQGKVTISNSETTYYSYSTYQVNLNLIDIISNIHLYVTVRVSYTRRTSARTGEVSESYTLTINANYYPTVLRTINNEVLLPHTHGNANLHDGFYFPNAVQDYDGNWYGAVVIGDQVWLAENLKSIHYSDGEEIPEGHPINIYGGNVDAARWYPNNDPETVPEYGCFYNWKAATRNENYEDTQTAVIGISPGTAENGDNIWHIPSRDEFSTLISYIKNQQRYSNAIGRSVLKFDMDESQITNNKTGLNLPYAGYYYQSSQKFGERATLISSSLIVSGNYRNTASLHAYNSDLSTITGLYAMLMGSVRCVSNLTPIQFRNWYIQQYGSLQHHLPEEVQIQSDWNQTNANAPDFIKNKPTIGALLFYGYTNSTEVTATKVVTFAEPTTGFKNGTYIMVYFAGGGVPAGNDNAISIGNDVYYLAYKAQGITQAGVINQGDKVLLWCHNGFAHVISNDRWSLPTVTAADEGKILKVVNGALALVNP